MVDFKARALEGFPEFSTNFPLKIGGFSWLGDSFPSFGEEERFQRFFFRGRYTNILIHRKISTLNFILGLTFFKDPLDMRKVVDNFSPALKRTLEK